MRFVVKTTPMYKSGCVRLLSPGRPRCVAFFFPGRTCVDNYPRSSWEKNRYTPGPTQGSLTNAPYTITMLMTYGFSFKTINEKNTQYVKLIYLKKLLVS